MVKHDAVEVYINLNIFLFGRRNDGSFVHEVKK